MINISIIILLALLIIYLLFFNNNDNFNNTAKLSCYNWLKNMCETKSTNPNCKTWGNECLINGKVERDNTNKLTGRYTDNFNKELTCMNLKYYNCAKPEQAKPDQSKPDQAKPDQAKPDQAKPDQAKPDQAKPDQAKPDQAKPDQAKPHQAKPDQAKPEQAKVVELGVQKGVQQEQILVKQI